MLSFSNICHTTDRVVVDTWNSLPEYVVEAASIKSFEHKLDQFWTDQPIHFDHESQIIPTCIRENLNRMSEDSGLDIEDM